MVFYFTATGNSLYVAKQLEKNFLSIPQELKKENREYCDKKIGIVCPLFEFEIPDIIKKFIEESKFKTDYFYLIITYGCHDGGSAERTQKFLKEIDKEANYINTLKMADNALIVFDMAEQKRIDPEKKIDENLKKLKTILV